MANVIVSRQVIDENNQISWEYSEVDESELVQGELPVPEKFLQPE